MKKTLQNIMLDAWRFFRTTGLAFADCLRKAWAVAKLTKSLHNGIVRFFYQKVDGTIREAWGTLSLDLIPPTGGGGRKKNDTVQTYYDTEKQEWRCFKKLNIVTVTM